MARSRQPITQPSIAPTTKVAAGGAAGALTVLVVWILGLLHVPVPPEVVALAVCFMIAGHRADHAAISVETPPSASAAST